LEEEKGREEASSVERREGKKGRWRGERERRCDGVGFIQRTLIV
jgi:hypothetical protein